MSFVPINAGSRNGSRSSSPVPFNNYHQRQNYGSYLTPDGHTDIQADDSVEEDAPQPSLYSSHVTEKLRRHLKFHFMNPWEKWLAKRKFPWKLILQIIKLICVTVQLGTFGASRSSHVDFIEKSTITFRHLYLRGWDSSFETMPYPPSVGVFSVYTIPNFYKSIDYTATQYNRTEDIAIGTYDFDRLFNETAPPIRMCNTHYVQGKMYAYNQTYVYDSRIEVDCYDILPVLNPDPSGESAMIYDIEELLASMNKSLHFDRVKTVQLNFILTTIHLKELSQIYTPDCFKFNITITYENSGHNGQMTVDLTAEEIALDCKGIIKYMDNILTIKILKTTFDSFVILISLMSCILCARSLYRAQKLKKETTYYFKHCLNINLTSYDKLEFLDLWYVMIVINDILTVSGSVIKLHIENKTSFNYEACGVLLGTGNLLVWFGVLRYLGMFQNYNVLILTMKKAVPNVLRFLVCAGVFYLGFTFCGWVVLGPYHIKFRNLSTTSECLFSLINGDDMFVTFQAIDSGVSGYIWIYSRIYLYIFISLFIYIVLSVFISVIMDTYETIKHGFVNGFPKSDLQEFISKCQEEPRSPLYMSDQQHSDSRTFARKVINAMPCCNRSRTSSTDEPNERSTLIT